MKVVILAGGRGLRYNDFVPKPLATIGDKPIVQHVMEIYSSYGYNDFILCLGWKKEKIIEHFNRVECAENSFRIEFVDTGEDSNTGRRIKLIEKYIPEGDENFFCTYSDGLADVDMNRMFVEHKRLGYVATLTAIRPQNVYGIINIGFNGIITKFNEKPKMKEYINGGFFVFKKDIFDYISSSDSLDNNNSDNSDLEIDVFPRLTTEGKLGAYKHEGFWDTLNNTKDERRLNDIYSDCMKNNKKLPWL